MVISTREQLKEHIHSIHDYLRNSGAGYGMTAMKIFSFFYGLKIIEPLVEQSNLDPELCKFSNLMKIIEGKTKKEIEEMPTQYIINDRIKDILKNIQETEAKLAYYVHHHLPSNLNDTIWMNVIKLVNEIPSKIDETYNENVNLSGKVYEYFIGRDATAISELGAYFTDRHITKYVIDKVKPTLFKDGIVKTMIDVFGGSGGFTLGYAEYLNNKSIDWMKQNNKGIPNYQKIFHMDMNEDVVKIAGLEYFTFAGKFPVCNASRSDDENVQFFRDNTFQHEFTSKFDYIFTNPPYGGDKSVKKPEVLNNDKIIEYIKGVLQERNKLYLENEDYINAVNKIKLKAKHKKNIIDYSIEQLDEIMKNLDDGLDDLQELLLKIQSKKNNYQNKLIMIRALILYKNIFMNIN
jgi:methylase of polypeptide subunit release factors